MNSSKMSVLDKKIFSNECALHGLLEEPPHGGAYPQPGSGRPLEQMKAVCVPECGCTGADPDCHP